MSYKNRMVNSEKSYHTLLNKKNNIEAELEQIKEQISKAKEEYITNGLLYYDEEKRNTIITKAEDLCYSKTTVDRLKEISSEVWNPDNIDEGIISDFNSLEEYVKKNTPRIERSILTKIGNIVLDNNKEKN